MKRIIIHWTAGSYEPSKTDLAHYHFVIDGDGQVINGALPVEANKSPIGKRYAAHTLNCNTDSIGVAIAAMAGAKERPFTAGRHPITPAQVNALAVLCAALAKQYSIPVTPQTILTHAEVQPTLGIRQRGKWDITWLPGMAAPGDPVTVGDRLRTLVSAQGVPAQRPENAPPSTSNPSERPKPQLGIGAAVAAVLAAIAFGLSQAWERISQFFGG